MAQDIKGMTALELVLSLLQRAVQDLSKAIELLDKKDKQPTEETEAVHLVEHAQQVISLLRDSMDTSAGSEIVNNLASVYDYTQYRLSEGVSKRDAKPLQDALMVVTELRDTWVVLCRKELLLNKPVETGKT